jgi:cysteine desulfurase
MAIGASDPRSIIFTSGATESNNMALRGVMNSFREKGDHLVISSIEHQAVRDTAAAMCRDGFRVTAVPVDGDGIVDPNVLREVVTEKTVLVSVMHANNEIGVIQPLADLVKVAHSRGALFHTDAAQSVGHIPANVAALQLDLMSLSSHKLYGPKGVGALYVRCAPHLKIAPMFHGGGQEFGLRSGTLNVPGIVGFGAACELAVRECESEMVRTAELRDRLASGLLKGVSNAKVNGHLTCRLPGNLNISLGGIEAEPVMLQLFGRVALSTGSACSSSSVRKASHVLKALGMSDAAINSTVRFGVGRFTTAAEIDYVVVAVAEAVERTRALFPKTSKQQPAA